MPGIDLCSSSPHVGSVETAAIPLLTVEHYKRLPEDSACYQLVEGEIHIAPAPNRYHQDISRNLEYILLDYLDQHPIGKLYDAPFDVYLDEHNVFQPDIVFVSKARLSILTDAGAEGTPDFVVEILSPKTAKLDRDNKRRVYARTAVQELWIIAPETRRIEVYLLGKDAVNPAATYSESDSFESTLFPGLRFEARTIFAR